MTVLIDTDFDTTNIKLPFISCTSAESSTFVVHSMQTSYPSIGCGTISPSSSLSSSCKSIAIDRTKSRKGRSLRAYSRNCRETKSIFTIYHGSRKCVESRERSEVNRTPTTSDATVHGTRLRLSATHSDSRAAHGARSRSAPLGDVRPRSTWPRATTLPASCHFDAPQSPRVASFTVAFVYVRCNPYTQV